MLTTSAFNALLKTLEEPPENVVFILATTEQHKIPVTIMSRCLKFEFNRISEENLYKRIKYVLDCEHVKYEDEACRYIATLADGAARDALSILDRCISETEDVLKYKDVENIVGAIDKDIIKQVADCILEYNPLQALDSIDEVIKKGKDLRQFTFELTNEFLNRMIKENNNLKRYSEIIDKLSSLDNELKSTTRKEIVLKSCIVQLCNEITGDIVTGNGNIDDVYMKKIEKLEKQVASLQEYIKNNRVIATDDSKSQPKVEVINKSVKENKVENTNITEENLTEFPNTEELKKAIIEKGKIKVYSALAGAKVYVDDVVRIITKNNFAYNILKSDESIEVIAQVLFEKYKINKNIILELKGDNEESISKIEKVLKDNNIEYTKLD